MVKSGKDTCSSWGHFVKRVQIKSDPHVQSLVLVYKVCNTKLCSALHPWSHGVFWCSLVLQGIPRICWVFRAGFECFLMFVILRFSRYLKIGLECKTRGYHSFQIIGGKSSGVDPYHQSPCGRLPANFCQTPSANFPTFSQQETPLQSEWSPTPTLPDDDQAPTKSILTVALSAKLK